MLITDVWKKEQGAYFFLATKNRDDERFNHDAFTRKQFGEIGDWIDAHRSIDVYWGIGGYYAPHRREAYASPSQFLRADCDTIDPRKLREPPTIVWESSPKHYHALWECDRPVSKGLRKGWCRHVGGDPGAWLVTQILRCPGTRNHKYPDKPRVKVLRRDGPLYRVRDLQQYAVKIPDVDNFINDVGRPHGDARAILKRYRIDRTLLTACQPPRDGRPGYRSSVVHRLACLLVEAGAGRQEVAAAVFASASFRSKWGRNLTRLWAEVDAAFAKAKR
jgi:RepB DNA-primase from phage plasmid